MNWLILSLFLIALDLWQSYGETVSIEELEMQAKLTLFQIDQFMAKGSSTFGRVGTPNYDDGNNAREIVKIHPLEYHVIISE